jgi:hypothetical protein
MAQTYRYQTKQPTNSADALKREINPVWNPSGNESADDAAIRAKKTNRHIDGGAVIETGRRNVARYMDGVGLIIDESGARIR